MYRFIDCFREQRPLFPTDISRLNEESMYRRSLCKFVFKRVTTFAWHVRSLENYWNAYRKEKESAVPFWEKHNGRLHATVAQSVSRCPVEDGRREPDWTERARGNRRLVLNPWPVAYGEFSKQWAGSEPSAFTARVSLVRCIPVAERRLCYDRSSRIRYSTFFLF